MVAWFLFLRFWNCFQTLDDCCEAQRILASSHSSQGFSLLGLQNVHTIHSSVRGRVGHAHINTHGKSKEEGPREGQQQERRA